jgi:hypothetical protein
MPCIVDDYGDTIGERNAAVNLLCSVCTELEARGIMSEMPPAVLSWWSDHRSADRRNRSMERANADRRRTADLARSKLTYAEREALGIR